MVAEKKIMADPAALVLAAAEQFIQTADTAIKARGVCYIALAGGSTPKGLYQKLATEQYSQRLDWSRIHLFFGDERCVMPDHADSNFRMASEAMMNHIDIPITNIHRMPTELSPERVAISYEEEIKAVLNHQPFDLVLLGLGPDGHIASLFPDTAALSVTETLTTALYVEKFDSWRVTMTYPVLNSARQVIVFIAGEAKAEIVQQITTEATTGLPVQQLAPRGQYYWYLDRAAAGMS